MSYGGEDRGPLLDVVTWVLKSIALGQDYLLLR